MYENYPVQVETVRKFTSGISKGLTHTDFIGFLTKQDARAWAASTSDSPYTNYIILSMTDIKTGEKINFQEFPR